MFDCQWLSVKSHDSVVEPCHVACGETTSTKTLNILPIGSMYGTYANIWDIWMVNVTIYSIHGSYGL